MLLLSAPHNKKHSLTYFWSMFPFYTPCGHKMGTLATNELRQMSRII